MAVADASTTPDTINIQTTQPIVLTQGQLLLSKSMTVAATAGTATISGDGLSRVFEVGTNAYVTLNALNITGGNAGAGINQPNAGYGGGIMDLGLKLTLTNCTLFGNSAAYNGGAIFTDGTLLVNDCTLSGNSAAVYGGAIDGGGTMTVTNSTLSGNSAEFGGAIAIGGLRFTLTVEECTFSGNSAAAGGAIWADIEYPDSSAWIASSTFSGNTPSSLWSSGSAFWGEGDTGLPPGAVVFPPFPHYYGG